MNTTTEAVNALLDGVTAGPWYSDDDQLPYENKVRIWSAPDEIAIAEIMEGELLQDEAKANAHFIAAARELVPALLAERDAAIARAERAEAERDAAIRAALDMAAGAAQSEADAANRDADDARQRGFGEAASNIRQHAEAMESVMRAIRAITVADVLAKVGAK